MRPDEQRARMSADEYCLFSSMSHQMKLVMVVMVIYIIIPSRAASLLYQRNMVARGIAAHEYS